MWFLLILFLNPSPIPGMLERSYVINVFDTEEECQVERNRVGFDMAESYPYDRDFVIVCEPNKRKVRTAWATVKQEHLGS